MCVEWNSSAFPVEESSVVTFALRASSSSRHFASIALASFVGIAKLFTGGCDVSASGGSGSHFGGVFDPEGGRIFSGVAI